MSFEKKKALLIFLLCNVLALLVGAAWIFHGHQEDITLYDIPLYDSEGIYAYEKEEGGGNLFTTRYPVSEYKFVGRTGPLRSGIYEVKVYYGTYDDYYWISCEAGKDGNSYPEIYADSYILSANDKEFSYKVWVNSDIDYLNVCIECGKDMHRGEYEQMFETDSHFFLDRIEVTRDYRATIVYKFVKLFALLMILDGIFCVWCNRKKIQDHFYVVFGLACIFLFSSLSLMGNFNVIGHDMIFHYARIVGLADGLANGIVPVKIQPGWFHGYGYAVSVCYGDILLYFPAVLYLLGVPIYHAYKLYVMFINLGTLLISFFCFKRISRSPYISAACTALYVLSTTRILNVYLRAAVGEYSAVMFFPLIVLGMHEIYGADSDSNKKTGNGWLFLSIGMTGVIQTHVISTVMVSFFLALTALILIRKMSKKVFLSFVKSVLSALCFNLGYLLPFMEYTRDELHVFGDKRTYSIQQFGLSVYELFSVGTEGVGVSQNAIRGPQGRIPESLGAAMILVMALAIVVVVKCQNWKRQEKKRILLVMLFAGIALWMSTHYFPYNSLAGVGFLRKYVRCIQFPWRFLSIAMPLLTYMSCLVFMKMKDITGMGRLTYLMVGICLVSAFQSLVYMDSINRNWQDHSIYYDFRCNLNKTSIAFGEEYLLEDSDTELTQTDRDVTGENVQAEILERKGLRMDVACTAQENAWIEAPQFAYWHYQCRDLVTKEQYPITRGENNKIHVDLPDHYQGTLRIDFVEPWYWRLAEIVSLVSIVFTAVFVWKKWRSKNPAICSGVS